MQNLSGIATRPLYTARAVATFSIIYLCHGAANSFAPCLREVMSLRYPAFMRRNSYILSFNPYSGGVTRRGSYVLYSHNDITCTALASRNLFCANLGCGSRLLPGRDIPCENTVCKERGCGSRFLPCTGIACGNMLRTNTRCGSHVKTWYVPMSGADPVFCHVQI